MKFLLWVQTWSLFVIDTIIDDLVQDCSSVRQHAITWTNADQDAMHGFTKLK